MIAGSENYDFQTDYVCTTDLTARSRLMFCTTFDGTLWCPHGSGIALAIFVCNGPPRAPRTGPVSSKGFRPKTRQSGTKPPLRKTADSRRSSSLLTETGSKNPPASRTYTDAELKAERERVAKEAREREEQRRAAMAEEEAQAGNVVEEVAEEDDIMGDGDDDEEEEDGEVEEMELDED